MMLDCGFGPHAVVVTIKTETGRTSTGAPTYNTTSSTIYGTWEDKSGGLVITLGSAEDKRIDAMYYTSNDLVNSADKFTYASKDYVSAFVKRVYRPSGVLSHYEVGLREDT